MSVQQMSFQLRLMTIQIHRQHHERCSRHRDPTEKGIYRYRCYLGCCQQSKPISISLSLFILLRKVHKVVRLYLMTLS